MSKTPPTARFVCAFAIFLSMSILSASAEDALQSLVDAEKAFAQTSMVRGVRASFLKFFADGALIFAPGPTDGKKVYAKYDDKGRSLFWQPAFATIAKSGQLGVTTGPWEMRAADKPIAFGEFVSVWKKQNDGAWKVIFDSGVEHAQPTQTPDDTERLRPNEPEINVDLARRALDKADETLRAAMKEGGGNALGPVAAEEIRILRDGVFPAVGQSGARLMLTGDQAKTARTNSGGGMSASGDLAYKFGSYSAERGNATEHGHFLTVWRAQSDTDWKIIVDLQKKDPPKKS